MELGPSRGLPFKYFFTGRKPVMHPSGLGNIHTELIDGILTGTRNPNWETVQFISSMDDLRLLLIWNTPSWIDSVQIHFSNTYQNYQIDRVDAYVSRSPDHFRLLASEKIVNHPKRNTHTIRVEMAVPQIELVLKNRHYYQNMQINEVKMFGKPLGRANHEQVDLAHRITLQKWDRLKEDPDFYKNRLLSGPDYIEQELINSMRLNNYPQVACNPLDVGSVSRGS